MLSSGWANLSFYWELQGRVRAEGEKWRQSLVLPEMFSSSRVCHEVRDPLKAHRFGAQKLTLPPDYLLSNHVQVSSPLPACEDSFPFPPVILLETFPGASHTLFWVLRAQQ